MAADNKAIRLRVWLETPVDAAALALFRILFGALAFINICNLREGYQVVAGLKFKFVFIQGIPEMSPDWVTLHWGLTLLFAFGIMCGLLHRIASAGFLICFGLFFLQDKCFFMNHYYLILLLSFLMIFVKANACWSLDALLFRREQGGKSGNFVPRWHVAIFQAQIVIAYFYAGVAKVSPDWLRGVPTGSQIRTAFEGTFLESVVNTHGAALAVAYTGMIFDLVIGFLLLAPRTRFVGTLLCLVFHLSNAYLFDIGVFPWLMIGTLALFWPPDWPRRAMERFFKVAGPAEETSVSEGYRMRGPIVIFLSVYLLIQLLLPIRHWAYSGSPAWTGEGRRFAWMMKLREHVHFIRYYVEDPASGKVILVPIEKELTGQQFGRHSRDPDMIWQYAQHLRGVFEALGLKDPRVFVDTSNSMNGRQFQPLIDRRVDLAHTELSLWKESPWIVPLRGSAVDLLIGERPELPLENQ